MLAEVVSAGCPTLARNYATVVLDVRLYSESVREIPHRRVKTGYLEGNLPHLVMDLAETLYTSRHRVRRSGELNPI